jgi:hypothetical protein
MDRKSRKLERALQESREQAELEQDPLPHSEWGFYDQPRARLPKPWQLNHWLNYEYARSSSSIVKAVLKLRAKESSEREAGTMPFPCQLPRFAVYLANCYPEFPATPWLELSDSQKKRCLLEAAGSPVQDPFEETALKVYDTFEFCTNIEMGNDRLEPFQIRGESFGIFEIDFRNGDERLVRKFREWLRARRKHLIDKYKNSSAHKRAAGYFKKKATSRGQHRNQRQYEAWMKRLAALRLMVHHQDAFLLCWQQTGGLLNKPLYADDQTAWDRPKREAATLLKWFAELWQYRYHPPFGLRPEDFDESLLAGAVPPILNDPRDIRPEKSVSRKRRKKSSIWPKTALENFLRENFLGYGERQRLLNEALTSK